MHNPFKQGFSFSRGKQIALASFLALTCLGVALKVLAQDIPVIAAASDLQSVLPNIAERFRKETGLRVNISFGASGNLMRQIEQGGPYQVFFSADEGYVKHLEGQGFAKEPSQLYAIGQLVLWTPNSSPIATKDGLSGVKEALRLQKIDRLAIANPKVAPYGRAAQQALEKAGLWNALQGKIVQGENIAQTAQFASSGSTQGGLISLSLALSSEMQAKGRYALVPKTDYLPLRQSMLLLKKSGPTAEKFYRYVQTPAIRQLFGEHGLGIK